MLFILFAAFPAFGNLREVIEAFIFENFVPTLGDTIQEYIVRFADKARGLTIIGLVALVVTVLAMMSTIETTFNVIWGVKRKRPVRLRILVYWAVLTLGPVLIGGGLVVTSYIASLPLLSDGEAGWLLRLVPFVLTTCAFVLLFKAVPNRPVPTRHALVGALAASLLFELAKRGFAWYVVEFPAQQAIYGAFATVPIFLLWIYISWLIVLLGAEVTQSLTMFEVMSVQRSGGRPPAGLHCAFRVLVHLHAGQQQGRGVSDTDLYSRETHIGYRRINQVLDALNSRNWINRDDAGNWVLTRDLHTATLADLAQAVPIAASDEALAIAPRDAADQRLAAEFDRLRLWLNDNLQVPLAGLLASTSPQPF